MTYSIEEIKQAVRDEVSNMDRKESMFVQGVVYAACQRLLALRQPAVTCPCASTELKTDYEKR